MRLRDRRQLCRATGVRLNPVAWRRRPPATGRSAPPRASRTAAKVTARDPRDGGGRGGGTTFPTSGSAHRRRRTPGPTLDRRWRADPAHPRSDHGRSRGPSSSGPTMAQRSCGRSARSPPRHPFGPAAPCRTARAVPPVVTRSFNEGSWAAARAEGPSGSGALAEHAGRSRAGLLALMLLTTRVVSSVAKWRARALDDHDGPPGTPQRSSRAARRRARSTRRRSVVRSRPRSPAPRR